MARSDVLVSTEWAEQNLNADKTVFVEVDEDTSAYDGGHIPGAIKLDWKKDLQDQVRRDFVNREQFSALLSERGIANDAAVRLLSLIDRPADEDDAACFEAIAAGLVDDEARTALAKKESSERTERPAAAKAN